MQETKESHDKLSGRSNVDILDEEGSTSTQSRALGEVEGCPPVSGPSHQDISGNRRNQVK